MMEEERKGGILTNLVLTNARIFNDLVAFKGSF